MQKEGGKIVVCVLCLIITTFKAYGKYNLLDSVINTTKTYSLNKNKVQWKSIDKILRNEISPNTTDSVLAVIPAIQKLYTILGDYHGFLTYNGKTYRGNFPAITTIPNNQHYLREKYTDEHIAFRTKYFGNKLGYISIPALQIDGTNSEIFKDTAKLFRSISEKSKILQDSLLNLLSKGLNGIIVDLRLIPGGTMHILIEGLAPILGDGIIMYDNNSCGISSVYRMKNSNLFEDSIQIAYSLNNFKFSNLKIAILIGSFTASAGEQTAICFKGKNNVRFFGEKTAGYTTMNNLKNNWHSNFVFAYTTAETLDRNKKPYTKGITPDVVINNGDNFENIEKDKKVMAAMNWLSEQQ